MRKRFLIPLLAALTLPIAFNEEPAKSEEGLLGEGLYCFDTGRTTSCINEITYEYYVDNPDWKAYGSCKRNQPYEVIGTTYMQHPLEWIQALCSRYR